MLTTLIGQANTLICGTTFGYMEPTLELAADAPQPKLERAYMAGGIAGKLTWTNTLGVIGSIPSRKKPVRDVVQGVWSKRACAGCQRRRDRSGRAIRQDPA